MTQPLVLRHRVWCGHGSSELRVAVDEVGDARSRGQQHDGQADEQPDAPALRPGREECRDRGPVGAPGLRGRRAIGRAAAAAADGGHAGPDPPPPLMR